MRLLIALLALAFVAPAAADPQKLYAEHCASCHGADRLGGVGPALLPENLERLRRPEATETIAKGRVATQMPGFADKLAPAEIEALVELVYAPVEPEPRWGEAEIRASRIVLHAPGSLPDKPEFKADPLNLFVVVETGDHHVTVLDGDKLEPHPPLSSRASRCTAGRNSRPTAATCIFASRDGWITQVRPVEPRDGGRGARRHQHAQRRGVERRQVRRGRELPAAHAWSSSMPT